MPDSPRLTPLAVMILALLHEGEMHPYEMIRLLRRRRDDRLVPIQNGTFYHTVSRLEREDLLAEVGTDRDGNRPERTTYRLTDAGEAAVIEWVRRELVSVDRVAEFRVALAEAHNLERAEVVELLDRRREALAASRDEHRSRLEGAAVRRVPEQFIVEIRRQSVLLEAELDWQDALRAQLADGSLPWGFREIPDEFKTSLLTEQKTLA